MEGKKRRGQKKKELCEDQEQIVPTGTVVNSMREEEEKVERHWGSPDIPGTLGVPLRTGSTLPVSVSDVGQPAGAVCLNTHNEEAGERD